MVRVIRFLKNTHTKNFLIEKKSKKGRLKTVSDKKGLERENKMVDLIHDFVGDELNHFGINVLVPKEMEKVKTVACDLFDKGTVRCTVPSIR